MAIALELLSEHEDVEVVEVSTFIDTPAVSKTPQPHFLNAVVELRVLMSCRELFEFTQAIEKKLGRVSKGNNDPRTIDLDLLFFNADLVADDDLVVPHPLLHDRSFVMEPLLEIAPHWVHPVFNMSIVELYQSSYEKSA